MSSQLLPGENLILKYHPHWIVIVKSLAVPIILLIIAAVVDFTMTNTGIDNFRVMVSLAAIAIAGLWLIVVWIRWQSTSYTLTDQRIKIETGVFGRQSKMIPIDRVQDCTTKQSLVGRMLGYGRVEVDAAGAQGAEVLNHLPNPGAFRDQVFVQSEKRRGGSLGSQPHPSGI
jgi:Predicted membrane protein